MTVRDLIQELILNYDLDDKVDVTVIDNGIQTILKVCLKDF